MRMLFFLLIGVVILWIVFYMVYLAHHDTIESQSVIDQDLPDGFNNFRLLFISDIHRRKLNEKTINNIEQHIDMVIIGGDLKEKGVPLARVKKNVKLLKKWKSPMYFIWGNNDYEENPDALYQLLKEENVVILANETEKVAAVNGDLINLVGLDCCKYKEARFDLAINGINDAYTILVTHAPSGFFEMEKHEKNKVNLVLAGHTHGGQIRIFGFGPYEKGSYKQIDNTNMLVSEGYGYTKLPLRLGTKSECHVLHFKQCD